MLLWAPHWPWAWRLPSTAKPIRLLVGFPPGGGTDAIARTLSEKLKDELGQPVVVENRPGAGGQIAAQALKASAPDGTTLFLTHDHTISILPQVVKNPGYEPARDFVAVGGFATFVNAFAVSGGTPAKSFTEYVQLGQDGRWQQGRGGYSCASFHSRVSGQAGGAKVPAGLGLGTVPGQRPHDG